MKFSNCGKIEFENMKLYQIDCNEGSATQLVKAYVYERWQSRVIYVTKTY